MPDTNPQTIASARWVYNEYGPASDSVAVVEDDGSEWALPYPVEPDNATQQSRKLDAWVAEGNTIAPADRWYGMTDEEVREIKYEENEVYAQALVDTAETTPIQGITLTNREKRKNINRRNNAAKHKNNQITNQDEDLLDHIDQVLDAQNLADDTVENLTGDTLRNWTPDMATWPVWTPPTA